MNHSGARQVVIEHPTRLAARGLVAAVQRCSSAGWRLAAGMAPTRPESQEAVYHEVVSPHPTLLVARR